MQFGNIRRRASQQSVGEAARRLLCFLAELDAERCTSPRSAGAALNRPLVIFQRTSQTFGHCTAPPEKESSSAFLEAREHFISARG